MASERQAEKSFHEKAGEYQVGFPFSFPVGGFSARASTPP